MSTIIELLRDAELKLDYDHQPETLDLQTQKPTYIISDLHLARGRDASGNYAGTENFYYDDEFARFMRSIDRSAVDESSILIINGDFVDFLRVTDVPTSENDFLDWHRSLARTGIEMSPVELRASITKKEYEDGLKTHEFKSVWKMMILAEGHREFFQSVADWLAKENEIIILKGNHDLEWMWPGVRNNLRLTFAEIMNRIDPTLSIEEHLSSVCDNMLFVDKGLTVNGELYIEHGHRFDPFSGVRPAGQDYVDEKREELNIPLGSFFNRYLINKIELAYPFYDNVRPRAKLLPMLIRERLPLAIKLLFWHLPFVFNVLFKKKRIVWSVIRPAVLFIVFVVVPLTFTLYQLYLVVAPMLASAQPDTESTTGMLAEQITSFLMGVGSLVASYFLARFLAYFQLEEPSSLAPEAEVLMRQYPSARYFVMGHTHNPEQFMAQSGQFFYNSGTWIPIVETSSATLRADKTFTLLRFSVNAFGKFSPTILERWNDDAERIEALVLTSERPSRLKKMRTERKTKRLMASLAKA